VRAANWRASCAPSFGLSSARSPRHRGPRSGGILPQKQGQQLSSISLARMISATGRCDRSLLCSPAVRTKVQASASAAGCRRNGAPVARRAGGGKARRGARRMRARALRAHGCALSDPRNLLANLEGRMPGRRATWGVFLLVTFLCTSKEKLPARPQGEWKLCTQGTTRAKELDSGLTSSAVESRRNDGREARACIGFRLGRPQNDECEARAGKSSALEQNQAVPAPNVRTLTLVKRTEPICKTVRQLPKPCKTQPRPHLTG